jgi:hypothetical protein
MRKNAQNGPLSRRFRAAMLGGALLLCWVAFAPAGAGGPARRARRRQPERAPAPEAAAEAAPGFVRVAAGRIRGSVTEPDAATPHRGLAVVLRDLRSGREVARATTDASGGYTLAGVPASTYRLTVGAPGVAATLRAMDGLDEAELDVIIPRFLVSEAPSGVPAEVNVSPTEATAIAGERGPRLVANCGAVRPGCGPPHRPPWRRPWWRPPWWPPWRPPWWRPPWWPPPWWPPWISPFRP